MKIPENVHLYAVTERITQQHSGPACGSMQIEVTQAGVGTHFPPSSTPPYEPVSGPGVCWPLTPQDVHVRLFQARDTFTLALAEDDASFSSSTTPPLTSPLTSLSPSPGDRWLRSHLYTHQSGAAGVKGKKILRRSKWEELCIRPAIN